ncbi:hypothetical protein [Winogradskyella alexanderae]|uniref:Uncharacterized protein n=1 Tax=Winogradskyella alexanderae TaxID=2877123 RepID=A0ABS7XUW1_9FLAO|nr:hypothetical protein [Winogradskyella alexanderae]MCA0133194.1 hypothetical protein [Winogradskyella alexanderae]
MKIFVSIISLAFINTIHAQFISSDDMAHFGVGAVISGATYTIVYNKTQNKKKAFWFSLATAGFVGLAKEVYDGYIIDGRFDTGEAVATFSGGLVASYTINIFTGKRKKKKRALAKSIGD